MHGYIQCSIADGTVGKKGKRVVDTLEDLEKLYDNEQVELQEIVMLNGVPTTFGRAKMESYLGTSLNKALGHSEVLPLVPLSGDNIEDLMRYIAVSKDPGGIIKDIRIFVLEMSTIEGFSSLSLPQLYSGVPKEFLDQLEDIRNNPDLDGIQKFIRISEVNNKMKGYVQDNMDQDLKQTMINSNRMKISALLEMTLPQATVDDDGNILSNESSLYQSLNEEEYRAHSLQNRMILNLKQQLVPRSGYLSRQMTFLSQSLEYRKELNDTKNIGVLIPHKVAEGRTTIDGKTVRKSTSDKLIRVRSIAVSEKKFVCPDHLSKVNFPPEEITPAWGLRAVTSLTEKMTQMGLSLKHSGSFVQVPKQNQLYNASNISGTISPDVDKGLIEIISADNKVTATYPLPNRFDIINMEMKSKGDYIGTTLATASAGLGLDIMITIMNAKKAMPDEGLAKNDITLSNCFAPIDGEIKYHFDKGVYFVGEQLMGPIDKKAVFYYPDGHKVKKYDRLHSHPLDTKWYLSNGFPLDEVYFMFRKEFREYVGYDTTEELLETLFHLLVKKDFSSGEHEFLGATRGIKKGNNSFFAQLSFERGKSAISRLAAGELKFENDIFTRNILDHLIISAKDKTQKFK